MIKVKSGIYQSLLFDFPDIIHGFSTKQFGNMRDRAKRKIFLSALRVDEASLVQQEQIHKAAIHVVNDSDRGRTIRGADGLVYKYEIASPSARNDKLVVLSVHTADCVPLLAVDPIKRIVGVAHAGWKGTTLHIGKKCIGEMEKLGGNVQNIHVVIGPRIGVCCYQITKDRADVFRTEFTHHSRNWGIFNSGNEDPASRDCVNSDVIKERNGNFFADIGKANYIDLLAAGVKPEHIDYDPSLCTCCRTNDFYSFRKGKGVLEGEMLGVIGFRKPI